MIRPWLGLALLASLAAAQDQTASISGIVLGTNGVPLSKATVTLQSNAVPRVQGPAPAGPWSATSDSRGHFSITDITPGSYALSADHVGYLRGSYAAKGPGPGTILNLLPGDTLSDLSIYLVEQGVITGKVLDEDGDPVRNLQVRLLRRAFSNGEQQLNIAGNAQVNDIGEFRVAGVSAGQYYLVADPPRVPGPAPRPRRAWESPNEQPILTYYPRTPDIAAAVLLRVHAGETLAGMDIRLAKAAMFEVGGTVTGIEGNPRSYSVVLMAPNSGGQNGATSLAPRSAPGVVNNDGHFDIPNVPAGNWRIIVTHSASSSPEIMANREIAVSGDINDLSIGAVPPASIHGTVRFERPDTAANTQTPPLHVVLQPLDAPLPPPNADVKENEFTLQTTGAGNYRLILTGIPQDSYLKSATLGGHDVLAGSLILGEGGAGGDLEVVVGSPSAELFGVILGPDGNNAPGSVVTLAPESNRRDLYRRANTDQNGTFSIRGLAPGAYHVYAWDALDPGEESDPELLKSHEDKSSQVTVSEGDRTLMTLTETTP